MNRMFWMLLLSAGVFALASCGSGSTSTTEGPPQKLIITAIPDDGDSERMSHNFGLIAKVIEDAVGIPTEYIHVPDYNATVVALNSGNAHMAWFGAVTTGQAAHIMGDAMTVVACRDIDKGFVSYFIAHHELGLSPVSDLKALADNPAASGWNFTFGSASSTSSHVMPRFFLESQAGRKATDIFRNVAFSGAHDVVLAKVANGEFQMGALGTPQYDGASDDLKANAPIIYTTPEFTNYCFAARTDLGSELIGKIRAALLELHNTEEGKEALGYLGAQRFVEAEISEWEDYIKIARDQVSPVD
jgi:phosphonate transport system substrate-binding protein